MGVNLTTNPYIVQSSQVNRPELPTEVIRSKQVSQRNKSANSLPFNLENTNQSTKSKRNVFTLPPSQSQKVTSYRNNESSNGRSYSPPISQYLQTENISKREALESLVRVDLFA